MPHDNRVEQLEDLKNIETNGDFYEKLAAGSIAYGPSPNSSLSSGNGGSHQQPYFIPVPITIKSQLGNPVSNSLPRTVSKKVKANRTNRLLSPLVPSPQLYRPSAWLSWVSAV